MALARADRKIILVTSGLLVVAALFFASVLVFATGGGRDQPADNQGPLYIGPKRDLFEKLNEGTGSPLYFANPFGGRGFWLDQENGNLVALDVGLPSDPSCSIKWKGRIDTYTDCHGRPVTMDNMARHPVSVSTTGKTRGGVYVSLDETQPAPDPA